jgi:hypothetical protein
VTAVVPRAPEAFLAARVDELDGHWMELHCGCGLRAFYPFCSKRPPGESGCHHQATGSSSPRGTPGTMIAVAVAAHSGAREARDNARGAAGTGVA